MNIDLEKKIEAQKKRIKELQNSAKFKKRREVTKNLLKIAERSQILDLDFDCMFGAFLEISEQAQDPKNLDRWKNLAKQKNSISSTIQRFAISFKSPPPMHVKEELKKNKFRWNNFRNEFYGTADLNLLKEALKSVEHEIIEL